MAELSYEYIANMVRENLGEEGIEVLPLRVHDLRLPF